MNLGDIKLGGRIFQLSAGYSGMGKTVGSGSYPKPLVLIDLDLRAAPLRKMYPQITDEIKVEQFGPFDFLRFWKFVQDIKEGNTPYKTAVLGSLTSLARMTLNYSVGLRGKGSDSKRDNFKSKGVIELLEIEDFGAEGRLIGTVLDIFRAAKVNFIMEAHLIHTTEKNIASKKETEYKSLLTGGKKIAAEIPGYFDEVYYFFARQGLDGTSQYFISTVPMNDISAKTALPLPAELEFTMEPGGDGLYQKIQAACKEKGVDIG